MAPKKNNAKAKSKVAIDDTSLVQSMQQFIAAAASKSSQRSRAKKYSKDETKLLAQICHQYDPIISKNSNSDADKKIKVKAWQEIQQSFEGRCRTEGIFVSNFSISLQKNLLSRFNLS